MTCGCDLAVKVTDLGSQYLSVAGGGPDLVLATSAVALRWGLYVVALGPCQCAMLGHALGPPV